MVSTNQTFAQRLEHAFSFKRMPAGFDDLLQAIIDECEPKAAAWFAKRIASRRYLGPRSIADGVDMTRATLWHKNPEWQASARKYLSGLAAIADGVDSFDEEGAELRNQPCFLMKNYQPQRVARSAAARISSRSAGAIRVFDVRLVPGWLLFRRQAKPLTRCPGDRLAERGASELQPERESW